MKALVLYNPFSGRPLSDKSRNVIEKKLASKYNQIDFFPSTAPKSITDKIISDGNNYDLLVVSGGDGTLNEAINGIVKGDINTPIGYIPSGTVNDVGLVLKLSKNVSKALDVILQGNVLKIDAGMIDDRVFSYVCAAGSYTSISYDTDSKLKKKYGRLAYFLRALQEIKKPTSDTITISYGDCVKTYDTFIFLALNYQQFGGFKIFRKRRQKINDGIIDFTFVQKKRHYNILRILRFIFLGDRVRRYVNTISTNEITLQMTKPIDFNIDGEYAFTKEKVTIRACKERIAIIVPKKVKDKNTR